MSLSASSSVLVGIGPTSIYSLMIDTVFEVVSKICLFLYGESSVPLSSLTMEFSRSLSVITMIFGVPLTFRLPSLISSFYSTQLATSEFCLCNPLLPESDAYSSCLLGGTRLAVSYAFEVVTFFRP